jgi:hypothetical protein
MVSAMISLLARLDIQHDEREFIVYGSFWTVLTAGPAMPAFIRIDNLGGFIAQVYAVQRAYIHAGSAGGAKVFINQRRHFLLSPL